MGKGADKHNKLTIIRLVFSAILALTVSVGLCCIASYFICVGLGKTNVFFLPGTCLWCGFVALAIAIISGVLLGLVYITNLPTCSTGRRPQQTNVSNPDINDYPHLVQLVCHADKLNWDRLYYFLVFNSIMFLAWATIFAASCISLEKKRAIVLSVFSLFGSMVSILWWLFAIPRGISFQDYYMKWARLIERVRPGGRKGVFETQDSFAKGGEVHFYDPNSQQFFEDEKIPWFCLALGARQVMSGLPFLFVAVYLILAVISCTGP